MTPIVYESRLHGSKNVTVLLEWNLKREKEPYHFDEILE